MRAWVLHGINDIRLEDVEMPLLKDDEVCLKVEAAGICGSDIPRIFETGAHNMPLIPGHEFAGVVEGIGRNVGGAWPGRRVGVFPLIPCGNCGPCQRKRYEMCRNYGYLGSRSNGGFAEYAAVPVRNLIWLPDSVSYEEAAMLEPMAVAVHAMRRGISGHNLGKDAAIAVCGLGTIGLLLVMFLLEAGFNDLYVVGNKDAQREKAVALGLLPNHYCDSRRQDVPAWLKECTGGVELFFECVGKNETFVWGVDSAAPSAGVVLVGNPYTDMELDKEIYWKILRNQLTVCGTWNSSFTGEDTDDWNYVMERLKAGKIHPAALISHLLPLDQLRQGLDIMHGKKEDYGKIMVSG